MKRTTNAGYKLLPPPPRLAGLCIREAIRREATEIVMTSDSGGGTVRIEGEEKDFVLRLPLPIWHAVLQTLKAVAGLDPDDSGRPQNGRARYGIDGKPCDLIVVTATSPRGESAVISIVHAARIAALDAIGVNPASVESIRSFLQGSGMLLLAGGQQMIGRVLTAASDELLRAGKEVVELDGGGEREATGRSLPNARVAIVGRMTDAALAAAAVAANVRGHLVVLATSALDAFGAMQSLVDFGVDSSLVMELEPLVVMLHGIRRLCRSCAEPIGRMTPSEQRLSAKYAITPLFRAVGCPDCDGSGFAGLIPHAQVSIAIEPVPIDDSSWAAELISRGQTTIEEVARLLGTATVEAACA
jgi:type II secretory ATPase GspE/PulE/Tfp pilus assembly ATPase PilB-like protein